eukprot:TRINITY_DN10435_c0_g1_i1.p1 TRINITY_DN10435_c0_g1~~TRINITY_DN10435_c0_g1_i1.p1  ORF type:complete len:573 (-),score=106.68 TRINITY_DN10435_c0_g1_i1:68-1786(-)
MMQFPFADDVEMWSSNILPQSLQQEQPPHQEEDHSIADLEAIVLHKPRGSKGIWRPIGDDERLRTTKDKGKRLKVEIHLSSQLCRPAGQITLALISSNGQIISDGYSVESIKSFETTIEVEIKVFLLSKGFRVSVTIPVTHGNDSTVFVQTATSKELTTHNSGARGHNGKEDHAEHTEKKRKQEPHHNTSPNPNPVLSDHTQSSSPDTSPHQSSPPHEVQTIVGIPSLRHPMALPSSLPPSLPLSQSHQAPLPPIACDPPASMAAPMGSPTRNQSPGSPHPAYLEGDLDVEGTVRARAFHQLSDIRLKCNIDDIADAMGIITKLQAKSYYWRRGDAEIGGRRVIGMIAQEVQRVLPEVVYEDPHTGLLSVSYVEILPVLVEAYKQFLAQYKLQHEDIQSQIYGIEDKVEQITQMVGERAREANQDGDIESMIDSVASTSRDFLDKYGSRRVSRDFGKIPSRHRNGISKIPVPPFPLWVFLILGLSAVTIGFIIAITNLPQEISDDRDMDSSPTTTTTQTVVHFPILFVIGTSLCVAGVITGFFAGAALCIQKYTPKIVHGTDMRPLVRRPDV